MVYQTISLRFALFSFGGAKENERSRKASNNIKGFIEKQTLLYNGKKGYATTLGGFQIEKVCLWYRACVVWPVGWL